VTLILVACAPSSTATSTATTSAPTAQVATTATARPVSSAGATLTIDPAASQASYHAREQLAGKSLASDAIGTSNAVTGTLVLAPDGSILSDQSQITVDLSKLQSDESRRDNWIKNNTIQTSQYPTATFVPRAAQDLPIPLPVSGEATFQLSGDLTVHGVTKPATWQVSAQFSDGVISGKAITDVNITDFGMTPPRVGPVLSIEDGLRLELAFSAARAV
jgi:polyisoprenoid-binding protein YceI